MDRGFRRGDGELLARSESGEVARRHLARREVSAAVKFDDEGQRAGCVAGHGE